jgi:hypothetical protein
MKCANLIIIESSISCTPVWGLFANMGGIETTREACTTRNSASASGSVPLPLPLDFVFSMTILAFFGGWRAGSALTGLRFFEAVDIQNKIFSHGVSLEIFSWILANFWTLSPMARIGLVLPPFISDLLPVPPKAHCSNNNHICAYPGQGFPRSRSAGRQKCAIVCRSRLCRRQFPPDAKHSPQGGLGGDVGGVGNANSASRTDQLTRQHRMTLDEAHLILNVKHGEQMQKITEVCS